MTNNAFENMGIIDASSERAHIESFSLISLFESINKEGYALIKTDVPYMPDGFPECFTVGKDIDIVCTCRSFRKLTRIISEYIKNYARENGFTTRTIRTKDNARIRMEQNHILIIQFDISYSINNLERSFIEESIRRRVKSNNGLYYKLDIEDELIIRLNECENHPEKPHHFEFISSNIDLLNKNKARKSLIKIDRIKEFCDLK